MTVPCKDCEKRKVGCHSTCEDYGKFVAYNEERKRAIRLDREIEVQQCDRYRRYEKYKRGR